MKQKHHMLFYFVFSFALNMAANFVHPVTPGIIQELGLSDYMFGLAYAAMSLCNFAFSPFWGHINNYIGTRNTELICGIGYAVGQIFFGLARTELQFVLARMFSGVFLAGVYTGFLTYVVNCSDAEHRGRNLAVNTVLQTVSTAIGFFIGGMIGEADLFLPVWLQAASLAVTAIALRVVMLDDSTADIHTLKGPELARSCNPLSSFLRCAKYMTPLLLTLFLYYGLFNLGFTALDQCFNYYIRDMFGLTSKYNGIIKAALAVISIVSNSTICMWILKKGTISRYLIPITAICTVTMLGVVLSNTIPLFIAANVLFFTFYYIALPLTQDMAARLSDNGDSNLIMGAFNAMKNFGAIFGALFSGFIYTIDPKLPFWIGIAAFAAATLLSMRYRNTEKREAVKA